MLNHTILNLKITNYIFLKLGFVVTALVLVILLLYLKDIVALCRATLFHCQRFFMFVNRKLRCCRSKDTTTSPKRHGSCSITYKENRYRNECIVKAEPRPVFTMAALLQIVLAFFQMVRFLFVTLSDVDKYIL